jgi:hypothetical protein
VSSSEDVQVLILSAPDAPQIENRSCGCRTADLSPRGLSLQLGEALPVGAMLEMRLSPAKGKGFWHIGRVAWSRQQEDGRYAVGVEFTRTPEATLLAWEQLIEEKLSRTQVA